jgi:hypothetical protein
MCPKDADDEQLQCQVAKCSREFSAKHFAVSSDNAARYRVVENVVRPFCNLEVTTTIVCDPVAATLAEIEPAFIVSILRDPRHPLPTP